jgi:hypothetical protein
MKKTIILLLLAFSLNATAQTADTTYMISGKIENFKMLFAALTQPADVTPNQVKAVIEWVSKGIIIDKITKNEKK